MSLQQVSQLFCWGEEALMREGEVEMRFITFLFIDLLLYVEVDTDDDYIREDVNGAHAP